MSYPHHYPTLEGFIDRFLPDGFMHISRLDPFIIAMEEKLRASNQFFYIADLIKIRVLFTSWGSQKIIGIGPEQVDTSTFFVLAHAEDQMRLNRAQAKLYKAGQELFIEQHGIAIVSTAIRERNGEGYVNLLLQTYSFYSEVPDKTVFTMIVATDLAALNLDKLGYHYYAGNNPSMFRYPDEALLNTGHDFTDREFEILELIDAGLGSEQIADKLSVSVNTVNTHRRNILKKSRKSSVQEVVIELKERGIL